MTKSTILITVITCLLGLAACKNDEPDVIANTLSLNMMNSENGKTIISGTDVYINEANNFCSRQFVINDLGPKAGFSTKPNLSQLSHEVALIPGHYYQIFEEWYVGEVDGLTVFPIFKTFFNVYANSWLYDKDKNIIGALIKFAETTPAKNDLPDWDTEYTLFLREGFDKVERASFSFPKGFHIFGDYDLRSDDLFKERLEVRIAGNSISFENHAYAPGCRAKVLVNVRNGNVFSSVSFIVTNDPASWDD